MSLITECIALLDTISALGVSPNARNYADVAPEGETLPYTVTRMDISETPALRGDSRTLCVTRLFQIDLWEARTVEDETLRKAIWTTVDGVELPDTFKLAVRSALRIPDPNYDLSHRAFTVAATQRVTP